MAGRYTTEFSDIRKTILTRTVEFTRGVGKTATKSKISYMVKSWMMVSTVTLELF